MSSLVSIDPGMNHCGVAVWSKGDSVRRLAFAKLIKRPILKRILAERLLDDLECAVSMAKEVAMHMPLSMVDEVVIEIPQLYRGRASRGDGNDLIRLSLVVGALAALMPSRATLVSVKPAEHKGQVPKEVTKMRVHDRLSVAECTRIELPSAVSLQHNVYDGIWIGLHALGRDKAKVA
jgi:hypothetical protein